MTTATWWQAWALQRVPSPALYLADPAMLPDEVQDLMGTQQHPAWHPEGDAYVHTLCVVDEAATIARREHLDEEQTIVLVMAALCHDLGKPSTTIRSESGNWAAPGHDKAGVPLTLAFLTRVGFTEAFAKRVAELVARHMAHSSIVGAPSQKMVNRLGRRLAEAGSTIQELAYLVEADASGRPPLPKRLPPMFRLIVAAAAPGH